MRSSSSRSSQIDWLLSTLRWVLLASVVLVIWLNAGQVQPLELLGRLLPTLLAAVAYNLVVMVLLVFEVRVRILPWVSLILDTFLSVAFLYVSGGVSSPLLYVSLFPILNAALRFNLLVNLLVTGLLCVASLVLSSSAPLVAVPNLTIMIMTALVAGAIGSSIRKLSAEARRAEEDNELHHLRSTREQARAIFEMASTLSATLNYQRILDAVLDVSVLGFKELGPSSTGMVSLVLSMAGRYYPTKPAKMMGKMTLWYS